MLNRINGKMFRLLAIVMGVVLLLIIVLMIFGGGKALSFDKIEDRMMDAAVKYYEDNEEMLPSKNGTMVTVSGLELENGYMPNISKMVAEGVVCNGEVKVYRFNDEFSYIPYLNCGSDYVTKELYKEVTKSENIVTTSSGLYKVGSEYVYRGFDVNNYVSFGDRLWRIVKVDTNGNIKLIENETKLKSIWDDSFNVEKNGYFGINLFYNEKTEPSKIYTYMEELLKEETYLKKSDLSKMTFVDVCYGGRVDESTAKDSSLECKLKTPTVVGLLNVSEFMAASLDANCKTTTSNACSNFNYLSDFSSTYWTSTPMSSTTHRVYKVSGTVSDSNAASANTVRTVINLNSAVVFAEGDGSLNSPYKIK